MRVVEARLKANLPRIESGLHLYQTPRSYGSLDHQRYHGRHPRFCLTPGDRVQAMEGPGAILRTLPNRTDAPPNIDQGTPRARASF
jgi:hypothetical protein